MWQRPRGWLLVLLRVVLWVLVVHQGVSLMVLLEGRHCLEVFWGSGAAKPQPEASVFHVVDCLHEVDESQDLVGRHLADFDMALCIDAVCKAVPVDEPAGVNLPVQGTHPLTFLFAKVPPHVSPSFGLNASIGCLLTIRTLISLSFFFFPSSPSSFCLPLPFCFGVVMASLVGGLEGLEKVDGVSVPRSQSRPVWWGMWSLGWSHQRGFVGSVACTLWARVGNVYQWRTWTCCKSGDPCVLVSWKNACFSWAPWSEMSSNARPSWIAQRTLCIGCKKIELEEHLVVSHGGLYDLLVEQLYLLDRLSFFFCFDQVEEELAVLLFLFVKKGPLVDGEAAEIAPVVWHGIKKLAWVQVKGKSSRVCHVAVPLPWIACSVLALQCPE